MYFYPQMSRLLKNLIYQNIFRTFIAGVLMVSFLPAIAKAPYLSNKELSVPPPRIIRTCCAFGASMGIAGVPFIKKTDITSVGEMGAHHYLGNKDENNGNIYTKRGGFLDLGHLRDCADWTAYLYQLIIASKENKELEITHLGNEGGAKTLELLIPLEFDDLDACELAGKIAYDLSLWHEIATWFGASYVPLVPERFSSFSPEDLFSNLLGVHLGMRAIQSDLDYNEAMTVLLSEMLNNLEAVSTQKETYDAMVKVDHIWYTSEKRLPNKKLLLKRYLDTDSHLTPWLVPNEESILPLYILNKPDAHLSNLYKLTIKLNFRFPVKTMFSKDSDRVITQNDFDLFTQHIQNELKEVKMNKELQTNRIVKREEKREKKLQNGTVSKKQKQILLQRIAD